MQLIGINSHSELWGFDATPEQVSAAIVQALEQLTPTERAALLIPSIEVVQRDSSHVHVRTWTKAEWLDVLDVSIRSRSELSRRSLLHGACAVVENRPSWRPRYKLATDPSSRTRARRQSGRRVRGGRDLLRDGLPAHVGAARAARQRRPLLDALRQRRRRPRRPPPELEVRLIRGGIIADRGRGGGRGRVAGRVECGRASARACAATRCLRGLRAGRCGRGRDWCVGRGRVGAHGPSGRPSPSVPLHVSSHARAWRVRACAKRRAATN